MVHCEAEGSAISTNPKLLTKSSSCRPLMDHNVHSASTLLPLPTTSQQTVECPMNNTIRSLPFHSPSTRTSSSHSTTFDMADMSPYLPSGSSPQRYATSTFNFAGPVLKDMRAKLESRLGVDLASFEGLLYVILNQQIQISKLHEEMKDLKGNHSTKRSDFSIPQANSIRDYLDFSKQMDDPTFKSNLVSVFTRLN